MRRLHDGGASSLSLDPRSVASRDESAPLRAERLGDRNGAAQSPWLTVDEAAELLRCKPQRIYEMRSSGRLTPHKEGGRAVVSRVDVAALVVKDA